LTSAAEVFVVQLARASRKANRFVRELPRQDREDILQAALLWCWENRESYSLTTSLETWFVNAVRDAFKQWRRGELGDAAQELNEIPTGDSTSKTVEAWESATKLMAALPPIYRQVARLEARGYTREEMRERGVPDHQITDARARIKQLRRLLPDDRDYQRVIRAPQAMNPDDADGTLSVIDREIEQLESIPRHGADCPVCWQCMYFYGLLPSRHKRVRMQIQEPEVREAVRDTEARKVEIATRVRAGG
jgi:hypothetical protein